MSVYVDSSAVPGRVGPTSTGGPFLTADSPAELHTFAQTINISADRFWGHCDLPGCPKIDDVCAHFRYDLTPDQQAAAVAAGAKPVERWEIGVIVSARRPAFRNPQPLPVDPDPQAAVVDVDTLPVDQQLMLGEVAARYRADYGCWTYPRDDRFMPVIDALAGTGLVWTNRTGENGTQMQVGLTAAGRKAMLDPDHETPRDQLIGHYGRALDEVWWLRGGAAYERKILHLLLGYKTLPKMVRKHLEAALARSEQAARGQVAAAYRHLGTERLKEVLTEADGLPHLTRQLWEEFPTVAQPPEGTTPDA